jgi:hypothetical protein
MLVNTARLTRGICGVQRRQPRGGVVAVELLYR